MINKTLKAALAEKNCKYAYEEVLRTSETHNSMHGNKLEEGEFHTAYSKRGLPAFRFVEALKDMIEIEEEIEVATLYATKPYDPEDTLDIMYDDVMVGEFKPLQDEIIEEKLCLFGSCIDPRKIKNKSILRCYKAYLERYKTVWDKLDIILDEIKKNGFERFDSSKIYKIKNGRVEEYTPVFEQVFSYSYEYEDAIRKEYEMIISTLVETNNFGYKSLRENTIMCSKYEENYKWNICSLAGEKRFPSTYEYGEPHKEAINHIDHIVVERNIYDNVRQKKEFFIFSI